ncbi:MAG: outer membrane beta-barrel protein [Candidatus Saccharicenans sp.]|uniref:outer membrane beta-barrel protein n=1 Tax=Candidatus Saccharicenans sp. TaxID=2819258 RepID=UPI00404A1252
MRCNKLLGLCLIILLMLFVMASSLEALAPRTLGCKIGYNRNQLRGQETGPEIEVTKIATNGVTIGLVGNIKILDWLYFQPEVLYFQKGGKYDVKVQLPVSIPGFEVSVIDTRSLEYLEIPLLLKVALPLKWPVKPTFLTGISAGLKLRGNLENNVNITISGYHIPYFRTEDITSQLNTLELSYVIGGGFDFKVGRGTLAIDQRFFFGLKTNKYETVIPASYFQNIGIPIPTDVVYRLNMNNYVFSVDLTYFF